MKQKLIPLAVACLLSGAAFAQNNVQVYGRVDVGFTHRGDNIAKGVKSQNSIGSGMPTSSIIGFTGVEDLGNGLKALFVLEAAIHLDDGNHADPTGKFFNEQAFVGLTGGFGTAIAGRLITPRHSFLAAIDPFAAGTVGQYRNVFGINGRDVGIYADVDRVDNTVAYVSPSFGGFNVTAAYATNAIAQEGASTLGLPAQIDNDGDAKTIALLPRYTNGPLDVGVSYQRIKIRDAGGLGISPKITQWTVGGTYDFKVVKLGAYYDRAKANEDFVVSPVVDGKLSTWGLGVTVPFGKHAIQASYNRSKLKADAIDDGLARQWAVGYTYSFSKRTSAYAAYSKLKNGDDRYTDVGDATNGGDGYQNGLQLGLRHSF